MKKAFIIGILALNITHKVSFADHLKPKESEMKPLGNLAHTNLSNFDCRLGVNGSDFRGANFENANLSGADLTFCSFFTDERLPSTNFNNSDLSGANLSSLDLTFCDFNNANLFGANLQDASLNSANLQNANLRLADLSVANLSRDVGYRLGGNFESYLDQLKHSSDYLKILF